MTLVSDAARQLTAQRLPTERACARCGAAFVGRGRARYCSVRCRNRASDAARRARGGLSQREIARAVEGARRHYEVTGQTTRWEQIVALFHFPGPYAAWGRVWDEEMARIEQLALWRAAEPG